MGPEDTAEGAGGTRVGAGTRVDGEEGKEAAEGGKERASEGPTEAAAAEREEVGFCIRLSRATARSPVEELGRFRRPASSQRQSRRWRGMPRGWTLSPACRCRCTSEERPEGMRLRISLLPRPFPSPKLALAPPRSFPSGTARLRTSFPRLHTSASASLEGRCSPRRRTLPVPRRRCIRCSGSNLEATPHERGAARLQERRRHETPSSTFRCISAFSALGSWKRE